MGLAHDNNDYCLEDTVYVWHNEIRNCDEDILDSTDLSKNVEKLWCYPCADFLLRAQANNELSDRFVCVPKFFKRVLLCRKADWVKIELKDRLIAFIEILFHITCDVSFKHGKTFNDNLEGLFPVFFKAYYRILQVDIECLFFFLCIVLSYCCILLCLNWLLKLIGVAEVRKYIHRLECLCLIIDCQCEACAVCDLLNVWDCLRVEIVEVFKFPR